MNKIRGNTWFCCDCHDGPNNYTIHLHCPNCSHQRCQGCEVFMARQGVSRPSTGFVHRSKDSLLASQRPRISRQSQQQSSGPFHLTASPLSNVKVSTSNTPSEENGPPPQDFAVDKVTQDLSVVQSDTQGEVVRTDGIQNKHSAGLKDSAQIESLGSLHGSEESQSDSGPTLSDTYMQGVSDPNPESEAPHISLDFSADVPADTPHKVNVPHSLCPEDGCYNEETSRDIHEAILRGCHTARAFQRLKYWLLTPQLQPGMIRLKFVCVCGAIVWDDYPESMRSRMQRLERDLNRFFTMQSLEQDLNRSFRQAPNETHANGNATFVRIFQKFTAFCVRAAGDLQFLLSSRRSSAESPDTEASARSGVSQEAEETSFYLTCVLNNAHIPTLIHTKSAAIYSDLDYFDVLRMLAKPSGLSLVRIFNPRRVVAIAYVKFELLFDNEHVEIRRAPDFPLDPEHYQPCKTDFEKEEFCPWGPNTLLHFYERRHKCSQHPKILARIPRKLKGKLVVSDDDQSGIGWGMHLVSDVDRFRVGIMGVMGLVVSSMMGILWAKLHGNDIQGGTGLAQCLMMFVPFFVALRGFGNFIEQRY